MRERQHFPSSGALAIAGVLEDAGVDCIAVHPRRRVDHYQGVADWRIIRALVEHVSVPVIGNGDIKHETDVIRMMHVTGCAGVMIGRAAYHTPYLLAEADALVFGDARPTPSRAEVVQAIHDFESAGVSYGNVDDKPSIVFYNRMEDLGWYLVVVGDESEMLTSDI